jgi:hypothetical protein
MIANVSGPRPFDAQQVTADSIRRRWEDLGHDVTHSRLPDGSVRLSAPGRSVIVKADGTRVDEDSDA